MPPVKLINVEPPFCDDANKSHLLAVEPGQAPKWLDRAVTWAIVAICIALGSCALGILVRALTECFMFGFNLHDFLTNYKVTIHH